MNKTYLEWSPVHLLPVRKHFRLLLIIAPARNQVSSEAVAMKVMIALGPDELIAFQKPEEADHALSTWQVALSKTVADEL